jgi:hypothetical protein
VRYATGDSLTTHRVRLNRLSRDVLVRLRVLRRTERGDLYALGVPAPSEVVVPNQPKTPLKRLRCDDVLWDRFGEVAEPDRSAVLRQFMRWYCREEGTNCQDLWMRDLD